MLLKKTYYHVSEILKEIFPWKIIFDADSLKCLTWRNSYQQWLSKEK